MEVERRHQSRQREEEQQRGQRRGVQRGQFHDGGTGGLLEGGRGEDRGAGGVEGPLEEHRVMMWPSAEFVQAVLFVVVFSSPSDRKGKSRC